MALLIKAVIFVGPTIIAFLFSWVFAQVFPHWELGIAWYLWWILVFVLALAVLRVTQTLFEKFLPISTLFTISLAFPDQAPSRLKVSLRSTNSRRRLRDLDEAKARGEMSAEIRNSEAILELVTALNTHDRFTRGHSERVQAYTNLIAEELELPEEDRHKLLWGALLHDLGKLDVPPEILNKPGRPDDDEWAILQSHPAAGMSYVEPLRDWLGEWIHAVDEHHLRFDGNGYPTSVGGRDISLAGRIVAIADAYDVMTSARSYKKPLAHATARQELVRGASTQFDPQVVRAFLAVSMGRLKFVAGPLSWFATGFGALRVPVGAGATAAVSAAATAVAVAIGTIVGFDAAPEIGPPAEIAFAETTPESSTTVLPSTAPSSTAPTTVPPTTVAPTTITPTTITPTTITPATVAPTTVAPAAPSIIAPATSPTTTTAPVAATAPTTAAPTTAAPTTTTQPDQPPQAAVSNNGTVGEALAAGQPAGVISASDPDSAVLRYAIVGGNHDNAFRIDANGAVWTEGPLDYEAAPVRMLNIWVSDGSSSVVIDLPVTIVNIDEVPVASGATAAPILENAPAGQNAGSITASDPENAPLTFAITSGNVDGAFGIDASGVVTTTRPLNYEADGSSRVLTVDVSDGNHTVSTSLEVAIADVDEAPTATANPVAAVAENAAAGQIAGSVVAVDPEGTSLSYSIVGGNHDGGFAVSSGGVITTTVPHDHEAAPVRSLDISVSDGTNAVQVTLTVAIADVNEAPSASAVPATAVPENAAPGQTAGSVNATDPENNALTYLIVAGNGDGAFAIDGNGAVTTTAALDYEAAPTRTLSIEISDAANTVTVALVVTVEDGNEPPSASAIAAPAIIENTASPHAAGSVATSDPEGDALIFSITAGNADAAFALDGNGVLTTVRALDFETDGPSRTVTVTVDDGTNIVPVDIDVTVSDVDEAPISAPQETATVAEGATLITIDLAAIHPDPEGLAVTVDAGSLSANHASSLTTNGSTISYVHDGSETTTDTITYTAVDPGSNATSNVVVVAITPTNDPPEITPAAAVAIEENRGPGQPAQTIVTTDPDGPAAATLSIVGGNIGGAFTINGSRIETVKLLDAETTAFYDLVVQADDGQGTSTETFRVNVTSVNESPAISAMADQNTAVRAPVSISVPVTDDDIGDGVSSISVTGLPPGLTSSYNQAARTVDIVGTVTDESFASTTQTITVAVTDDGVPPLTSPSRSFDLIFADIIISPHAGNIRITEVRYAESEKYNPAAPFDALIMDEFVEFTNFGPAHDIENFWLSDTKYPTGLDDLDFHGTGPILPDETGRIFQGFTQPTAFATNQIISSPIRRPTSTTYELDDGSTRPSATYQFLGTAYGFPAGPNSLWEAFNDAGDDIWFWDDQNRLVAFVAWDDGTGNDHIRERPDPSWGIWDPADELRLSGAAPGQSISLAGPTGDSTCWELTGSGTATCPGNFTSTNRDAGNTNPAGRISSQGRVN